MPGELSNLPEFPRDEAFAVTADFLADDFPQKVSLGAGVYRDENSQPWILPSVKKAKELLHGAAGLNHEYLPIAGYAPFLDVARELILGQSDKSKSNVVSIQTISGTGANHLGAAFLAGTLKPRNVFISDPTWNNHHLIWEIAAPNVVRKTYPYYNKSTQILDFEGMMSTLVLEAVEKDVVILHACAHNPTGIDPTKEQWQTLAKLFERKKLFAFFDSAYQGFATGDVEADAWGIRHFQETLFDTDAETGVTSPQGMCIAQSFAKNFGLYGERVGAFHLILPSSTPVSGSTSHLLRLVSAEMSNCPLFGCRIVHIILASPELRAMWQQDLQIMSSRIKSVRTLLRRKIEEKSGTGDWSHLESQIGMFSFTGLSVEQVLRLRDVHHVYLMSNGRASLSGVNEGNVQYVADAFGEVVTYQAK